MEEKDKARKVAEKVQAWANSPEGRKQILETLERSHTAAVKFDEACQIDPRILHTPLAV